MAAASIGTSKRNRRFNSSHYPLVKTNYLRTRRARGARCPGDSVALDETPNKRTGKSSINSATDANGAREHRKHHFRRRNRKTTILTARRIYRRGSPPAPEKRSADADVKYWQLPRRSGGVYCLFLSGNASSTVVPVSPSLFLSFSVRFALCRCAPPAVGGLIDSGPVYRNDKCGPADYSGSVFRRIKAGMPAAWRIAECHLTKTSRNLNICYLSPAEWKRRRGEKGGRGDENFERDNDNNNILYCTSLRIYRFKSQYHALYITYGTLSRRKTALRCLFLCSDLFSNGERF